MLKIKKMEFIADLHIHSKYSRATSSDMEIPKIAEMAELKGIKLVGTGDFTHPEWLKELRAELLDDSYGIYKYQNTYFMLTAEVNNIYSKDGKLRRIHNIIVSPDFATVDKINKFLIRYGNLSADGRPLLNLESKFMLEKLLEINPDNSVSY
ncbi:MAG: endonuclease Q family protein, partial [candidate division WOR-3 bacterium]|nr:endonuclease Q family protein [candidate division WOR-3 bacterium]